MDPQDSMNGLISESLKRIIPQGSEILLFGSRSEGDTAAVPTDYELPYEAVKEAIVNAVCHRDYTSNASVQVMLFRNRLEVWNPGQLPYGLTVQKLLGPHKSLPANPLLADPMFWIGYIEKVGTGTEDIVNLCKDKGLQSPEYHQEEDFRVVIWRKRRPEQSLSGHQVVTKLSLSIPMILDLLHKMIEPLSAKEMREFTGLKDATYFKSNVINPLITAGLIEMTHPDSPNSPKQRYVLTDAGRQLLKEN